MTARLVILTVGMLMVCSTAGDAFANVDLPVAVELIAARSEKDVKVGPRGGRYYITPNGKKVYCGKKNPRC